MTPESFREEYERLKAELSKAVVGQDNLIDDVLVGWFAGGHVLIEGPPGLGKTLLVRALARAVGGVFRRIQFTPDLMPSDVIGGNVFDQRTDQFVFRPGPVFGNLLLADEINRAPAKTQAALLEAMQERAVTVDGTRHVLPEPFLVVATQNPIEAHGTYPLPEAQLDRFLLEVRVRYPSKAAEVELLRRHVAGFDSNDLESTSLRQVTSAETVVEMRRFARRLVTRDDVLSYVAEIVERTRTHRSVFTGASPRASISLLNAAQARAASRGRSFTAPDDVKHMAISALRHRLSLQPDAELSGLTPESVITAILEDVPVPRNPTGNGS